MIYEICEKVKVTDKVKKYSKTHKFITGKTFLVQKEIKALGGVFDTLFKAKTLDVFSYGDEPVYKIVVKGFWVPNEKAEQADAIVINAN